MVPKRLDPQALGHVGSLQLPGETINGIANRGGDLLNFVLHRAGGIHQLGLDLLGLTLRLQLLIAGDRAGSGLKMSFGILGGGLDLVFESHGCLAMGGPEVEATAPLCLDCSHDDGVWPPMLMERQLPHDSVLAIGEPETDFRGLLERVTKHLWSPHLKMTNQGFFTMLRNINDSAIVPPRHQPVGSGEIVGRRRVCRGLSPKRRR